ncbi:MAG: acyl-CoA desaturase [Bacteroidetes bacterium]|nr:acyl-CoA desaturase [Bacteroidota bacterium]
MGQPSNAKTVAKTVAETVAEKVDETSAKTASPPYVRFNRKDPRQFLKALRENVNTYFEENKISRTADFRMGVKTAVMLSMFFAPLALIYAGVLPGAWALLLYAVMGLGTAGIGLGVMHDANHGSVSRRKWVNEMLGYTMNLVGGSSFTWKIQHNLLHHSYTNIYELDEDIHDKPFLRLSPHGVVKPHHRFQHLYALGLYCLATISWVTLKDFRQWNEYRKNGLAAKAGFEPRKELIIMSVTKALYFSLLLVLPIVLGVNPWIAVLGFVLAHAIAGFIITTIFQLAHVVEGPDHYVPHPSGTMENTWAIHQLGTTANFASGSPVVTWFTGGLNHQVEHHLFPHISHVHYRKLSHIVRQTAREFDLPYYEYSSLWTALKSHLRVLKALGQPA